MRRRNWRIIIAGLFLIVLAVGFFFFILSVASTSNDPAALMQTVGTVSGAAIGISVAMIIIGLIGKKLSTNKTDSIKSVSCCLALDRYASPQAETLARRLSAGEVNMLMSIRALTYATLLIGLVLICVPARLLS